ncbi:hypothetical protein TNCV_4740581 [Trichonephila clavipes]|nr:hypothetical protein TNCV_4740581 [Trichonephila clavipes]
MNVKSGELKRPLIGVVVRRWEVEVQVSSSSLDYGSKLRGPSPKALVLTYNDSSFENNTIAPINEPDLFARSEAKSLTSLRTPQNALTAEDMSDLPDLCIETSNCTSRNCLPEGKFLVQFIPFDCTS